MSPKTWYGMPAYTNADGKVVVFFQDATKFSVVEKRVIELVKAAIS